MVSIGLRCLGFTISHAQKQNSPVLTVLKLESLLQRAVTQRQPFFEAELEFWLFW